MQAVRCWRRADPAPRRSERNGFLLWMKSSAGGSSRVRQGRKKRQRQARAGAGRPRSAPRPRAEAGSHPRLEPRARRGAPCARACARLARGLAAVSIGCVPCHGAARGPRGPSRAAAALGVAERVRAPGCHWGGCSSTCTNRPAGSHPAARVRIYSVAPGPGSTRTRASAAHVPPAIVAVLACAARKVGRGETSKAVFLPAGSQKRGEETTEARVKRAARAAAARASPCLAPLEPLHHK